MYGYGLSLDVKRRDFHGLQNKVGLSWKIRKTLDRSGPCVPLIPVWGVGCLDLGWEELKVNCDFWQQDEMNRVIWKVPEMVSDVFSYFELAAGQVIMCGSPASIAAVARGDIMENLVDSLVGTSVNVV